jgi:hypothetical protein
MPSVMEKRKQPRSPTKLAVKYRLFRDGPPKFKYAQSVDVSEQGMSFQSSEFIPPHSPVLVEFVPPEKYFPTRFVSEVVHAREHAKGNHFIIGIEIEHMLK